MGRLPWSLTDQLFKGMVAVGGLTISGPLVCDCTRAADGAEDAVELDVNVANVHCIIPTIVTS